MNENRIPMESLRREEGGEIGMGARTVQYRLGRVKDLLDGGLGAI